MCLTNLLYIWMCRVETYECAPSVRGCARRDMRSCRNSPEGVNSEAISSLLSPSSSTFCLYLYRYSLFSSGRTLESPGPVSPTTLQSPCPVTSTTSEVASSDNILQTNYEGDQPLYHVYTSIHIIHIYVHIFVYMYTHAKGEPVMLRLISMDLVK